jgi:predicted DNA binding CopG/RHH family protein
VAGWLRLIAGGEPIGFSALATGARGNSYMTDRIIYTDGEIDEVRIIPDFLPSPTELAFREDTVKVTIALSRSSVEFFKEQAAKHQVSYQKMIRRLLDEYAARFGQQ